MAHSYISSLLFLLITFAIFAPRLSNASPSAVFIFGDSTSDVGTNALISNCTMEANFVPYGINFSYGVPTGRFSNGFIVIDFLCQYMGFDRSPKPYLYLSQFEPNAVRYRKGVSFASAGSGLLNTTNEGKKVISMSEQINQFVKVKSELNDMMGKSSADYKISKSIFLMSIGSNDIIQNFEHVKLGVGLGKQEFVPRLIKAYEDYLKVLYEHGARKFGVISVLAMGCCPAIRVSNESGGCRDDQNYMSLSFYTALDTLLHRLSSKHDQFAYSLGNTYEMMIDVIEKRSKYNLTVVDAACCGYGKLNGEKYCDKDANVCKNPNEHAFWDGHHPTQIAANYTALTLFDGEPRFVYPITFGELAAEV